MSVTVRFAPSPSGLIHLGNARTLLLNWLMRVKHGGQFILRFDDTDATRSKAEFKEAIVADLSWLGITPDVVEHQSRRFDIYAAAAERLKASGHLYPAYETADELDRRRKRQLGRGLPPVYDRAALQLSAADRAALEAEGRKPHWRFKLSGKPVVFEDLIRGRQEIDSSSLSDPVLIREDGTWLYTLPSVVDDIELNVTHVIRGEDHVTNTGVQIEIFEALGGRIPTFAHHSLVTGADGQGLSKRLGSLSLQSLRESGLEPMAVASIAALMGSATGPAAVRDMASLAGLFDIEHLSRAPARFEEKDLDNINAKLLHETPWEEVAGRLAGLGVAGGEAFWLAVRGNLTRFNDVLIWHAVAHGEITPVREDAEFLQQAQQLLPPAPWDSTTWGQWTNAIKEATGRKGKALFMPLRLALTGLDHGPELAQLLPLIGRERALQRL
jgi:glutamyl-tRNA synthetase